MPVGKKRCVLRGLTLQSIDGFYGELMRQLKLAPDFGRNLDALWDVLTKDVEGPFEIVWERAYLSKLALGPDYDRILRLFRNLEQERKDFTFTLT